PLFDSFSVLSVSVGFHGHLSEPGPGLIAGASFPQRQPSRPSDADGGPARKPVWAAARHEVLGLWRAESGSPAGGPAPSRLRTAPALAANVRFWAILALALVSPACAPLDYGALELARCPGHFDPQRQSMHGARLDGREWVLMRLTWR